MCPWGIGCRLWWAMTHPVNFWDRHIWKTEHEVGRTCSHEARGIQGKERSSLGNMALDSWERTSESLEHRWKGCGQRCWRWEGLHVLGPEERGRESQHRAHTWPTGWTWTPSSQWEDRADMHPKDTPSPHQALLVPAFFHASRGGSSEV